MKLIQTHSVGSDETAPYDVVDFDSKNAYDFVFEVLKNKKEWGYIEVYRNGRIEYRYGHLFSSYIPVSWKNFRINNIIASGGFSLMNYYIK